MTRRRPLRTREFDPRSLGLRLWLDPSMLRGYKGGDTVSFWYDRSGRSNHAQNPTPASQPTVEMGFPWLRARGMRLRFDGAQFLDLTNDTTGVPTSFFLVAHSLSGSVDGLTRGILVAHVHGVYQNLNYTPNVWGLYEDQSLPSNVGLPVPTSGPWSGYVLGAVLRAFNDVDLRTNGSVSNHLTVASGGQARGATRLGQDPSGVQSFLGGLNELIWLDHAASGGEARVIEEYLYRRHCDPTSFLLNYG